ncbi:DUF4389 domain-containing protein [Hyphomicrobium sp. D-2]|uniref:DUF4389 domain-containing protein n=1 Tax=Hyphomicrobium sp. D-2 TaxID=3041621 RepID=UPI0024560851|nr:DUF4389 domain-containing protein [Hyphomicrobium sp. D-2]MDH4983897.1 DUF4389 domain-containing protein [Hyphomicrobium sp. D-2]
MTQIDHSTTQRADAQRSSFTNGTTWMRGLYMVVLALGFGVGQTLLSLTAIAQFLFLLFSGAPNAQLTRFGETLAFWLGDTAKFLTCASEEKPFPWAAWPTASRALVAERDKPTEF